MPRLPPVPAPGFWRRKVVGEGASRAAVRPGYAAPENVPPALTCAHRRWRAALAIAAGVVMGNATWSTVHTSTLASGLTLIVDPAGRRGPVTVEAWVGSGTGDELPGSAGVAHLAEHVALAQAERERDAATALDGWVTPDATVFRAVVPSMTGLAAALGVIARAAAPDRDALAMVARERRAIAAEPPGSALGQALFARAWPGRHGDHGDAGPGAIAAYWRRSYRPARTTLVVRGADARAVERVWSPLAGPAAPTRRSVVTRRGAAPVPACPAGRWAIGLPVPGILVAPVAELAVVAALAMVGVARWPEAEVDGGFDAVELIMRARAGLLAITGRGEPPATAHVLAALARLAEASPGELAHARAGVGCPVPGVRGRASELAVGQHLAGDPAWTARFRARVAQVGAAEVARAVHGLDPARGVRVATPMARPARRPRRSPTPAAPVRATLASGVRVVAVRAPGAARVAIRVAWPGGYASEPAGARGSTALLAAVLPSACRGRDLAADVAGLGGALAGVAGRWSFGLRSSWPVEVWSEGLAVVAACATDPDLATEDVARERGRLRDLAAAIAGSPTRRAFRAYLATRWAGHPLGREPLADPVALEAITRTDLERAFADRYPAATAVIVVVGDLDPDVAIAAVRARFDRVPAARARSVTAARPRGPTPAGARTPRQVFVDGRPGAGALAIGLPGLATGDADRTALAVLAAILDGPGGRLRRALPAATVHAIAVTTGDGPDDGYLAIELESAAVLAGTIATVRTVLETLATEGPTAAEVSRATAVAQPPVAPADPVRHADALVLAELTGTAAAADPVDLAAVRRVAARVLRWDDAVVVTVRPPDRTPGVKRWQDQRVPPRRPTRPSRSRSRRRVGQV